jgi:hypothetical protein
MRAALSFALLLALSASARAEEHERSFGIWRLRTVIPERDRPDATVNLSTFSVDPPYATLDFTCVRKGDLFAKMAIVGARGPGALPDLPAAPIEVELRFDRRAPRRILAATNGALARITGDPEISDVFEMTLRARELEVRIGDDTGSLSVYGLNAAAPAFTSLCRSLVPR